MGKFDHLGIQVRSYAASRDWYVNALGLEIEFDRPQRGFGAVKDEADFALFIGEVQGGEVQGEAPSSGLSLWFQVADVEAFHRERAAAGVVFDHGPQKTAWGYGAQLTDPDGNKLYVWDDATMKAKA